MKERLPAAAIYLVFLFAVAGGIPITLIWLGWMQPLASESEEPKTDNHNVLTIVFNRYCLMLEARGYRPSIVDYYFRDDGENLGELFKGYDADGEVEWAVLELWVTDESEDIQMFVATYVFDRHHDKWRCVEIAMPDEVEEEQVPIYIRKSNYWAPGWRTHFIVELLRNTDKR